MAKRRRLSRGRPDTKATPPSPDPAHARPAPDQEAADGILVQMKKTELTIAGEQPDSIQKLPGYEIGIAIPDWDKNHGLLDSVRKGYLAQQKLFAKLQGKGASRPWMTQRFVEIDKAVAASLRTVAERIHTRRWRERECGDSLKSLQDAFRDLQQWTAKTTRYCRRAEDCRDAVEKETLLDAACLGLLKAGELINKVERMQHGFWEEFRAAHFLKVRQMRNLIGHTDSVEGEAVIPLGTGIVQELNTAVQRTLFPEVAGPIEGGFRMSARAFRELEPSLPGEKTAPGNSIAMIRTDDHDRFVIYRVGRSEENKILIASSATGPMNLSVYAVRPDPETAPASPDRQA